MREKTRGGVKDLKSRGAPGGKKKGAVEAAAS